MSGRVLLVDDDEAECELLSLQLSHGGFESVMSTSASAAMTLALEGDFDVVLTDLSMREMSGTDLCLRLRGARPDVPVIVVTGMGSMEAAIAAIRAGAYDFVTKPVDAGLLALVVARAVEHRQMRSELARLRSSSGDNDSSAVIGTSPAMAQVMDLVHRIASSDTTVLIAGETGTGKELIARAVHDASGRSGPFVAINCAAVPATLLESELFGHARGAFTDARVARTGLFVEAQGGTLFLDEIGELPIELQPKLLRALQERKVRPIGANAEVSFDARIITATNRDLEEEVRARRFREDLYYRINVVKLDLPPLRQRGNDVLALATKFLERAQARSNKNIHSIAPAAAERLLRYDWPGNVRDLENCIERAVALARFNQITVDDLPDKVRAYEAERFVVSVNEPQDLLTVDQLERRYIERVLVLLGQNKSRAAQVLGLDRRTLYRKLERWSEERTHLPSATPMADTGAEENSV